MGRAGEAAFFKELYIETFSQPFQLFMDTTAMSFLNICVGQTNMLRQEYVVLSPNSKYCPYKAVMHRDGTCQLYSPSVYVDFLRVQLNQKLPLQLLLCVHYSKRF